MATVVSADDEDPLLALVREFRADAKMISQLTTHMVDVLTQIQQVAIGDRSARLQVETANARAAEAIRDAEKLRGDLKFWKLQAGDLGDIVRTLEKRVEELTRPSTNVEAKPDATDVFKKLEIG